MVEMDGLSTADLSQTHDTIKRSGLAVQTKTSALTSSTGLSGDTGDEKERTIAKAALSIAELGKLCRVEVFQCYSFFLAVALIDGPGASDPGAKSKTDLDERNFNLRSIHAIAAHIPFIEDARAKVSNEMEYMIVTGLTTLVSTFSLVLDR